MVDGGACPWGYQDFTGDLYRCSLPVDHAGPVHYSENPFASPPGGIWWNHDDHRTVRIDQEG